MINIKVFPSKKRDVDLSFAYNDKLLLLIKNFKSRWWNPDEKRWSLSSEDFNSFKVLSNPLGCTFDETALQLKEHYKKEEEKKPEAEGKKESDYSEIKSGKEEVENLKKKGKNLSKIKDLQTKLNEFLPKEKQIIADGLYGKNTEDAIKAVASILSLVDSGLKGTDGKRMSPKFQYVLDKVS